MDKLSLKRRKLGLNSHFDRMVATMNTIRSSRRVAGAPWCRARSCTASSSNGSHDPNFTPKQLGKLSKDSFLENARRTRSVDAKESDWYAYAQTGYQIVEAVVRPESCTSPLPGWMASTFCVLEPNDPLRVLLPSLEVTQTPVKNDPFEKVSCSSQEEQIFAFCYPERLDNSPNPVAEVSTLYPTLSRNCEHHTVGNNTSTPSLRPVRTSESHLPMPTRSPYAVSDCVVSNRCCSKVALLHATSSSPSCKSEQSTAIKRVGVVQDVSQDAQSTPGPTYYCCKSYIDSTTEDGLSCNTTEDSSFVSDIDAIDFRWKPFLRSKVSDGDPTRRREYGSSQQMSLHFPVSGALSSGGLGLRSPVYTSTSPTSSPLARRVNARRICCPPASDDPRNLPRDQFPFPSDREESRIPSSRCAFPDEHLAVQAEPCKFITSQPFRAFCQATMNGSRYQGQIFTPLEANANPPRVVGYGSSWGPLPEFH